MKLSVRFVVFSIFAIQTAARILDFDRIGWIRSANKEQLLQPKFVEQLLKDCGLNNENPNELPVDVLNNAGGLFIYQYPSQFSKYITFLSQFKPLTYLEIGSRWGGTYVFSVEYLSRFQPLTKAVTIDLIPSDVARYSEYNPNSMFLQMNSLEDIFRSFIDDNHFDVIFIDGDHTYEGVTLDFLNCKDYAQILVFHDIDNDACVGVRQLWKDIQRDYADTYELVEFVEQYEEVLRRTGGGHYFGIGVAIRKRYFHSQGTERDDHPVRSLKERQGSVGAPAAEANACSQLSIEAAAKRDETIGQLEATNRELLKAVASLQEQIEQQRRLIETLKLER